MIDLALDLFVIAFLAWLSGMSFGLRQYGISFLNACLLIAGIAGIVMTGGAA